ncbi:MAG TPA: phosphopantothenoylcysteine decarboxylase, partial [Aquella sp.]|nr:phosphopantothenoylcysteine decarboxylase [Aquella sp.]
GRMPAVEDIHSKVLTFKKDNNLFKDIKILITAGSTREMIDPVRFIGNKSSGKMAFALAGGALNRGAKVTVIKGITTVSPPDGCKVINVISSLDMLNAVKENITDYDIFIACAAVSDYRVANQSHAKIKKDLQSNLVLNLIPNPDILAYVANNYNIFTVGFAAETENVITNAKNKLINKKIKLIIANNVSDSSIGFESDYNEAYAISDDKEIKIERNTKTAVAQQILSIVYTNYSSTYA